MSAHLRRSAIGITVTAAFLLLLATSLIAAKNSFAQSSPMKTVTVTASNASALGMTFKLYNTIVDIAPHGSATLGTVNAVEGATIEVTGTISDSTSWTLSDQVTEDSTCTWSWGSSEAPDEPLEPLFKC